MNGEHAEFAGFASHPTLSEEVVEGSIYLDRWRLRFISDTVTWEVPLGRVAVEVDQTAGRRACFSDPEQPACSIWTPDLSILSHRLLTQHTATRNQVLALQSHAELKRRIRVVGWFFAGFGLLAIAASLLLGYMVRSLAAKVPLSWEQETGEALLKEIQETQTLSDDPKLTARLDSTVAPLLAVVPQSGNRFQFHIVEDASPNAFALPGGHVLVHTGLLELAAGREELAGAMAHELAHVTQKHAVRQILSSAGPFLVLSLFAGNRSGLLSLLSAGSAVLIHQSFSQEFELEADAVGWDYLVAARVDPRGLTGILRKLEMAEAPVRRGDKTPSGLSSHPSTEKRIRRLEAKWRKLQNKSAFEAPTKSE